MVSQRVRDVGECGAVRRACMHARSVCGWMSPATSPPVGAQSSRERPAVEVWDAGSPAASRKSLASVRKIRSVLYYGRVTSHMYRDLIGFFAAPLLRLPWPSRSRPGTATGGLDRG